MLCKYKNVYYVTNCSTEVGEHPILFFLFFVEVAVREQQKLSLVPAESMLEVTPLVCVMMIGPLVSTLMRVNEHKHMSKACPGLPEVVSSSLYFFNQSFRIEYASMTTLFNFQFPESHKILFCWDADVRPKSEIHPISVFKNFEFPAP